MKTALRTVLGIVCGLMIALALVVAVELFSSVVHPFPEGFGGTRDEICRHVEKYPGWVLATVVPMWAMTACCGTWLARRIGKGIAATTVGLLLAASVAWNVYMLPYPAWFKIACLIAVPVAVVVGIGRKPYAGSAN